jgi:hypothetical protein
MNRKFFTDLYSDMRDSGLLPVAGVLLVALIAVPLLLGGNGGGPGPTPTLVGGSAELRDGTAGTRELVPVVLAEAPDLREYEKRLAKLQSRNPFKQQASGSTGGTGEASGSEKSSTGAGSAQDTSASAADSSASSASSAVDAGQGNGGGSSGQIEQFTIVYEVDVKVGEAGKAKKQKGVELLDYLPDRKHPVLQFVGVTPDLSQAVFVVSGKATSAGGDGKCVPNEKSCEFIAMSIGDDHRFDYEPDGRTYRIKLNKITEVRLSAEKRSSAKGSSALGRLGSAGSRK